MRSIFPIIALFLSFSLTLFSCDQEYLESDVKMNNRVCTFCFKIYNRSIHTIYDFLI
jgi:hypothetical protein